MRVRDLRAALEELRDLFAAGGAAQQERDLQKVVELLGRDDAAEMSSYLAGVRRALEPAQPERYVEALRAAGFDEAKFKAVLVSMKSDKSLDKAAVQAVGEGYGVIRMSGRSRDALIDAIEKHFYWLVYNRDADAMAKRATPW